MAALAATSVAVVALSSSTALAAGTAPVALSPGSAAASVANVSLGVTLPLLSTINVALPLDAVVAPVTTSANLVNLDSTLGSLGAFPLVNGAVASSTANLSASQATSTASITDAVVQIPGLTGADALLNASIISAAATCPTNLATPTSATVTLPTTVMVAGQTVAVDAGGTTVPVSLNLGLVTGNVTVSFSKKATTTSTAAATAVTLTVNVDAAGVATTAGTVTLASTSCTRPIDAAELGTVVLATINPDAGPTTGGGSATLTGVGLTGTTSVTIGGTDAPITANPSDTSVTVTVPAGAVGSDDVVVTSPQGTATLPDGYTYADLTDWTRIAGPDRFGTAIDASEYLYPKAGSASAVVLARADLFPDALVGGPLAAAKNAPLLLTTPTSLSADTATEITRVLKPGGTVWLLGGTSALSPAVATAVTNLGFKVDRLSGSDRFGTATAIAAALGDPSTIFEANGLNFPDALSAASAAIQVQGAILLTDGSVQSPATAAYETAHHGTWYAVGGSAASADPSAIAMVGSDRYATSILVADRFFPTPTMAIFASGQNFPDALAAGPILGADDEPLILVPETGTLPTSVSTWATDHDSTISQDVVLGGTAAVSNTMIAQVPAPGV